MNLTSTSRLAFSLLELFLTMSVLAILAAVGVAMIPGLFEGQKEKRAMADLAVMQTALEAYKTRFGTYPKRLAAETDMEKHLFNSLNGKVSGQGDATQVRPMLNLSVLDTQNGTMPDFTDDTAASWVDNRVVDPWGNAYVYRFDPDKKKFISWNNFNYVLFSMGPDGEFDEVSNEGVYDPSTAKNLDNEHAQ